VDAGLVLEGAEGAPALDLEDDLLDAPSAASVVERISVLNLMRSA